jgi:hypothetical protein
MANEAAVTTAAATVDGTGTVPVTGTGTVTTRPSQVAGSAQVAIQGTGAVTTAGATVWATNIGITGTGAVETDAPTVALLGDTPVPWVDPTTYLVRRQRRAQYVAQDNHWLFHGRFELLFEAGVGLNTGQGVDPQLQLRWSDNGGHTWSDEHWTSAGAMGQYRRRACWRRLGRSRKRIYEVTLTDPVKAVWLGAWLDVQGGQH